jgi:GTP:adenosylcobinamide-phosphate guanylyltransferase
MTGRVMIRSKLWFTCAAMHDPVTPIIVRPSVLGWKAKRRQVELTIERVFTGEELVLRMKGWVTADVNQVIEIIRSCGYLKVLDEQDLVVEVESEEDYEKVTRALKEECGDEVFLEGL